MRENSAGEWLKCSDHARVFVQSLEPLPPELPESCSNPTYSDLTVGMAYHGLIFESVKDCGRVPGDGYPAVEGTKGDSINSVTACIAQRDTNRGAPLLAKGPMLSRKSGNVVVETLFRVVGIARNPSKSPEGGVGAS